MFSCHYTQINRSTTLQEVKDLDAAGSISRNLNMSVIKDSVTVPDGGYTILRIHATNPGFWFFHCHIDFHAEIGMGIFLQVGEVNQMPKPPNRFPRCGNWKYMADEEEEPSCPVNSAMSTQFGPMVVMCVFYVTLLLN
ncbi:uncharacterized protein LOC134238220 [Saccostrea cucullata]|uniref:uncharacterized protein LOC134238220 n=1 Tax=Saccostrea cuccullata TaxID=36930 RepID=UPI002ED14A7E